MVASRRDIVPNKFDTPMLYARLTQIKAQSSRALLNFGHLCEGGPSLVKNSSGVHQAGHTAATICKGAGCRHVPPSGWQAARARHAGRLPFLHVSHLKPAFTLPALAVTKTTSAGIARLQDYNSSNAFLLCTAELKSGLGLFKGCVVLVP